MHYSHYIKSPPSRLSFLSENIFYDSRHNRRAQSTCPGQTPHSPVKTPNLPDKRPMTDAYLQACFLVKVSSEKQAHFQFQNIATFLEKHKLGQMFRQGITDGCNFSPKLRIPDAAKFLLSPILSFR